MKKIVSIAVLFSHILLTGCGADLYTRYALKDPVHEMDEKMLLAQLGKPRWVIDTTEFGGPRTYSYLYMSAAGCVSTYTVIAATRQVSKYQCIK